MYKSSRIGFLSVHARVSVLRGYRGFVVANLNVGANNFIRTDVR